MAVLNFTHKQSRYVFGADFISGRVKTFLFGCKPFTVYSFNLYLLNLKNGVKKWHTFKFNANSLKNLHLKISEADATTYKQRDKVA